jgi:iron(III) transport system permease protein
MRHSWGRSLTKVPSVYPSWFEIAILAGALILLMGFAVPLFSLIREAGSFGELASVASDAGEETSFTILVGLMSCVLVLPLGLALSVMLNRTGSASKLWWFLGTAPLAIPAPLVGIGLIAIWNHPSMNAIYSSALMPVMASVARFAPIAGIIMLSQLKRIDPMLIDAAKIIQRVKWRTWLGIELPMVLPGVIASMAIAFALTVGELGATLLVTPPGHSTLTIRIYNYLHYGSTENVAALSLIIAGMTLAGAIIAVAAYMGLSRRNMR